MPIIYIQLFFRVHWEGHYLAITVDLLVNPLSTEKISRISWHDTVSCGVTSSHGYVGWILSSDFDFLVIASSWIQPFFWRGSPKQILHWSLVAILSLPPSLTCLLMKPPHTELWPRKIKKPFHQNNHDGKACSRSELVSLVPHLTWRAGAGEMGEHVNTRYRDNVLRPVILLCLHPALLRPWGGPLLVGWRALWLPYILKLRSPRVRPSDGDLHFVF